MTDEQIVDKAKTYLLGGEVLASGYIMGVETSINKNIINNYTIDIRIRWNVSEEQYEKLIQKIQSSNLNVSLIGDV